MPERLFALLLFSLLCAAGAGAQEDSDRWYRVEMLVFEQPNGLTAEQWDPLPELRYPDTLRFLVDPRQLEAARSEYGEASYIDAQGRIVAPPPADRGAPAEESPAEDASAGLPRAFVLLPNAQQELRDTAAYMQRAGGYRTLFHEAWVQPVTAASRATPLALDRSGDAESWPELQGTITLSVARFLTLETNLWLNTGGNYLPPGWQMPPPPKAPPALLLGEGQLYGNENPSASAALASASGVFQEAASDPGAPGPGDGDIEAAYPYRHAVLHRQTRRMRSSQMHYLDHPLLGVIIKLTPIEAAEMASPGRDQ